MFINPEFVYKVVLCFRQISTLKFWKDYVKSLENHFQLYSTRHWLLHQKNTTEHIHRILCRWNGTTKKDVTRRMKKNNNTSVEVWSYSEFSDRAQTYSGLTIESHCTSYIVIFLWSCHLFTFRSIASAMLLKGNNLKGTLPKERKCEIHQHLNWTQKHVVTLYMVILSIFVLHSAMYVILVIDNLKRYSNGLNSRLWIQILSKSILFYYLFNI